MKRVRALLLAAAIAGSAIPVSAQHIPAPKLALIRETIASMRLDARIQGLIDRRVEAKTQELRLANPGLDEARLAAARAAMAEVYARHLHGRDGLMARVEAVLDRHLTEEDLRFARGDYRGSDQGKRYRELVPRIVRESLDAGEEWAARLEPDIRRRVEDIIDSGDPSISKNP